ncbi:MAG: GNAT family acetyltransferase [Phenylobacterium zucineum]|nr:MAG: GNAT family acetyltransferase [Phenylobacterium zucineum]
MAHLTNAFYTLVSLILMGFAAILVVSGPYNLAQALWSGAELDAAMVKSLSYLILSLAVFDVARYVFEEEVRRGREMRKAAETRRSITKFITVILIAVLMDALVALSRASQEEMSALTYPVVLILAGVALMVGLGVFQRLSATVEEKVGADDEAEERKAEQG